MKVQIRRDLFENTKPKLGNDGRYYNPASDMQCRTCQGKGVVYKSPDKCDFVACPDCWNEPPEMDYMTFMKTLGTRAGQALLDAMIEGKSQAELLKLSNVVRTLIDSWPEETSKQTEVKILHWTTYLEKASQHSDVINGAVLIEGTSAELTALLTDFCHYKGTRWCTASLCDFPDQLSAKNLPMHTLGTIEAYKTKNAEAVFSKVYA